MTTWIWPLHNQAPLLPDEPGRFGAIRRHDMHTGVDLYAPKGTKVLAVEAGVVTKVEPFTGEWAGSPWWNNTSAVWVQGESGTLVYGEVTPCVVEGSVVSQGTEVGVLDVPVLKRSKGRPTIMLHLEWMLSRSKATLWWSLGSPKPEVLQDPTPKLVEAAPQATIFNLKTYNGKDFT